MLQGSTISTETYSGSAEGVHAPVCTAKEELLERYRAHLVEREAAPATQEKYLRTARQLLDFLEREGRGLAKASLIAFKGELVERYAPATVNTMLAAVNGFVRMLGHPEFCVRRLRIQPATARPAERELSEDEYKRLVRAALAAGDECMALAIQTICATGIRVSELRFVTVEALSGGGGVLHGAQQGQGAPHMGSGEACAAPARVCRAVRAAAGPGPRGGAAALSLAWHRLTSSRRWNPLPSGLHSITCFTYSTE